MAKVQRLGEIAVHEMVADVAQGICAAFYEEAAKDNRFYKENPSQRKFVDKKWRAWVPNAVEIMGGMLDPSYPELFPGQKDQVYDALRMHWALRGKDIQHLH